MEYSNRRNRAPLGTAGVTSRMEDEIDRLIEAIGTAKRWQGLTAADM